MVISLRKNFFTDQEQTLVESDGVKAAIFRYESGVEAVRLSNAKGYIIILPYKGQMIWECCFNGRVLNMTRVNKKIPKMTNYFLDSYGCYLFHCGPLRMGCPAADDTHELHGELPYADYDSAALLTGEDERGAYIALTGTYIYNRGFGDSYEAHPLVKVYQGSSIIEITMRVDNCSYDPMELMYMAHINYRAADGARMVQSHSWAPDRMVMRNAIPRHFKVADDYRAFLDQLQAEPRRTQVIQPGDQYKPEICFHLNQPVCDDEGWAHFLQIHPDGTADFLKYRPAELDHNTRWISKYDDQCGISLAFPATADTEGYNMEKKKGNIKTIPPRGSWQTTIITGCLTGEEVAEEEAFIGELMRAHGEEV